MGISADRRTGYFSTSASNRAARRGEKMVMVSLLIAATPASTPVPTVRQPYPSLPRPRRIALFRLQSTPVVFNVLEDVVKVYVANPQEVKARKGHKTDDKDG